MALAELVPQRTARSDLTRSDLADAVEHRGRQLALVVLMWACVVVATGLSGFSGVVDRLSTDDAMRLVEVRDLIAGQSWFDLVQHRLNPPDGVQMHWSRVIDLPIALMLGAFHLVVAPETALKLTLVIWPACLLLVALFGCASASRTLAGPGGATLGPLMLLLSPAVTGQFAPGAIDHHGAQIALAFILLACAMKLDRSAAAAIGAGFSAALMLAIGMETLPHLATIVLLIALRWAIEGKAVAAGTRLFGLSFALSTAAVATLTLAPAVWSAPVCDALGVGHLVAAIMGGLGLSAAATISRDDLPARFAACAAIGVLVLVGVVLAAPDCLAAPYASLPEQLKTDWLADVREAQPFFAAAAKDPASATVIGLPLLALVGVAAWAAMMATRQNRWPVAFAVAAFTAACAVTLWQVRGMALAYAFGGVLLPMAALAIGRSGQGRARLILAIGVLNPMTMAAFGLGAAHGAQLASSNTPDSALCPSNDYRALDRLGPANALNSIDTGPFILAHSRLSVAAAPYHRNVEGLKAALDAFDGEETTARAVALSRRTDYVIACPTDGGVARAVRTNPTGFSAKLLGGASFDWLEPIDLGAEAKLKAWRVIAGSR